MVESTAAHPRRLSAVLVATVPPSAHSAGLYRAAMFRVGAALARRLPLPLLRALAAAAGSIYALFHPKRVRTVHRNLQLLHPALTKKAARQVYAEFAKSLVDYFHIGTRSNEAAVRIISRIDGMDHLHRAHAAGKGALVVTAHLGLFELGGLLLARHGYDAVVLTYPEPSAALTQWRADFRRRWKADTLEVGTDRFAFLEIAQRLRQGSFVATLIDRPHPTDSTPVQLPHGTAHFSTGILLLAAHLGVPVIPATMVRAADGRYHAQVFAPLFVEPKESRTATLLHFSQQISDTLLPVLLTYPEQWYQFVPIHAPEKS